MITYKGTNQNMSCRGFKYELGKVYKKDSPVELCKNGFHSCYEPLNVFSYYPPVKGTRYFRCKIDGEIKDTEKKEKTVSSEICLKQEMSIKEVISEQEAHFSNEVVARGKGMATFEDIKSIASSTRNKAATFGNSSQIALAGSDSKATILGDRSGIVTLGERAKTSSLGDNECLIAKGKDSIIMAAGYETQVISEGESSIGVGAGSYGSIAVSGGSSIAIAVGRRGRVKGKIGDLLTLYKYSYNEDVRKFKPTGAITVIVDGEKVKEDIWYCLNANNELIEYESYTKVFVTPAFKTFEIS